MTANKELVNLAEFTRRMSIARARGSQLKKARLPMGMEWSRCRRAECRRWGASNDLHSLAAFADFSLTPTAKT